MPHIQVPPRGSPCLQVLSVLLGATRALPAKMDSVPTAVFTCLSKIWPLAAEAFGGERIEDKKSVCNNSVSLFQVKEPI